MNKPIPVITVDGPSGTGKGTVSAIICQKLEFNFLDSGALYRLLALASKNKGISPDDNRALVALAETLDVVFKPNSEAPSESTILLSDQEVTNLIRTEECGNLASKIAIIPEVRKALTARQHAFCAEPGLVADGRDMGTVIFPNATLKIYLTATAEERGRRRHNQLKQKGIDVKLGDLFEEIKERDDRDSNRTVAPLKPADDAIVIDTSALSIEDVVNRIMAEWAKVS
jgi:cytidylate kinase